MPICNTDHALHTSFSKHSSAHEAHQVTCHGLLQEDVRNLVLAHTFDDLHTRVSLLLAWFGWEPAAIRISRKELADVSFKSLIRNVVVEITYPKKVCYLCLHVAWWIGWD